MATFDLPIIGSAKPDGSGEVYWTTFDNQLTLTNGKPQACIIMVPPSADAGVTVSFRVPQNYVGTPEVHIAYVIDGTPASVVAFGAQALAITDSETVDAAYGAEQLASNSTWTGYADEDLVEETITLSAPTIAAGDEVLLWFFLDDNNHTFTGNVLLKGLYFRYSDT